MPRSTRPSLFSLYSAFVMGWVLWGPCVVWAEGELTLDPDVYYEVTFQTSQSETRTVKPVKVLEVVKIANREFLAIESATLFRKTRGYVALERVSTILPSSLGGSPILVTPETPQQR